MFAVLCDNKWHRNDGFATDFQTEIFHLDSEENHKRFQSEMSVKKMMMTLKSSKL
jgi:hypothetical protein